LVDHHLNQIVVSIMDNKMQQFALNKSSFSLKNIVQNTQTLQLFRKKIKQKVLIQNNLNAKLDSWVDETKWSNLKREETVRALSGEDNNK